MNTPEGVRPADDASDPRSDSDPTAWSEGQDDDFDEYYDYDYDDYDDDEPCDHCDFDADEYEATNARSELPWGQGSAIGPGPSRYPIAWVDDLAQRLYAAAPSDSLAVWIQLLDEEPPGGEPETDLGFSGKVEVVGDLEALLGWVAPPTCVAVAVIAGGTAHVLEPAGPDAPAVANPVVHPAVGGHSSGREADGSEATGTRATGPAATGPAATGPAATGPAATGPAATGPAATGPAATGPAATGPAATGPAATGPAATGPAATGSPATGPAATRVKVVCVVDRWGRVASCTRVGDEHVLTERPDQGRLLDTLLRCFGLPTAPPAVPSRQLIDRMWLAAVASSGRQGSVALSWDQVRRLHPAVEALRSAGVIKGDLLIDVAMKLAPQAWSWEHIREQAAEGSWDAQLAPPELADWMDEGMFSRWVLEGMQTTEELFEEASPWLAPSARRRLRRAIS